MEKEKSPLHSVSVSLDSNVSRGHTAPSQGEPWNILVCSDLGFASVKPRRVYAAEWNEFMSQSGVKLSGAVAGLLHGTEKPHHVEYPVASTRDFSAASVEEGLGVLAPFKTALSALRDLLDRQITAEAACVLLAKTEIPFEIKRSILALLEKKGAMPSEAPSAGTGKSRLDGVLGSIDLGGSDESGGVSSAPASNNGAADALIAAVTQNADAALPRQELQRMLAMLEDMVRSRVEKIIAADFFSRPCASWQYLKQAAGVVGRKKGVTLSVYSCARDSMADSLAGVLQGCDEQGLPPDIVLIDNEYSFSTADIAQLELIGQTAAAHMCMAITSLDSHDALFQSIDSRDTLAQCFDDLRFLPLKKLRMNPAARSIVLCGPAVVLDDALQGRPLAASAGWHALLSWMEAFLSGQSPFECSPDPSDSSAPVSFAAAVPLHIVKDASGMGLTMFGSPAQACRNRPLVTLIDEQAAHPAFTTFGYNLAANRSAKLAAMKIAMARDRGTGPSLDDLKTFLVEQLSPYNILSAANDVSVVEQEGNGVMVTIDSALTVSGFPLHLQFTL